MLKIREKVVLQSGRNGLINRYINKEYKKHVMLLFNYIADSLVALSSLSHYSDKTSPICGWLATKSCLVVDKMLSKLEKRELLQCPHCLVQTDCHWWGHNQAATRHILDSSAGLVPFIMILCCWQTLVYLATFLKVFSAVKVCIFMILLWGRYESSYWFYYIYFHILHIFILYLI